jgi:glycine/D-amino acid oxidase-like deaminating enzyme
MEARLGLNLRLVKEGHARLANLGEELDCDLEWRQMGNLVLIDQERHWTEWAERARRLTAEGIDARMVSPAEVRELEPALEVDGWLGAAYGTEGNLNPFKFCHAYARAARQQGALLLNHTPVTGFDLDSDRIRAVLSGGTRYSAETVVVAAGPWTAQVTGWAGDTVPVGFHHAEAMVTEPLPPTIRNHVGLAGFYEMIHASRRASTSGVLQTKQGNLLITQSVEQTDQLHRHSTEWGLRGMSANFLKLFPSLHGVRLLRDWGVPSAISPDEKPILGWTGRVQNLFVAGRLHLNIATLPVVSDLAAGMVLGETVVPSLAEYSPRRFSAN